MLKKITHFTLIILAIVMTNSTAVECPLDQLKSISDGLNIEGGTIYCKYLHNHQIWSNLCIILDRPFVDGIEWQELKSLSCFPLKETSILQYNEAQVNFAYVTLMHYYITHAHQMLATPLSQRAKILLQVHRNSSGPSHIKLMEELLCQCYPNLNKIKYSCKNSSKSENELFSYFFPDWNVNVDFCYGVQPEKLGEIGKYEEVDIVLSISLVAGFHPEWLSGSLLIPDQYIPFYLKTAYLAWENKYSVKNHLNEILEDLIKSQEDGVLETVNSFFCSFNPKKMDLKAKKLTEDDFKKAILLQVDGIFNPSQLPQTFRNSRSV